MVSAFRASHFDHSRRENGGRSGFTLPGLEATLEIHITDRKLTDVRSISHGEHHTRQVPIKHVRNYYLQNYTLQNRGMSCSFVAFFVFFEANDFFPRSQYKSMATSYFFAN